VSSQAGTIATQLIEAANDNKVPQPFQPPNKGVAYIRTPTPANDNRYVGFSRVGRGLITRAFRQQAYNLAVRSGGGLAKNFGYITGVVNRSVNMMGDNYFPGIGCGGAGRVANSDLIGPCGADPVPFTGGGSPADSPPLGNYVASWEFDHGPDELGYNWWTLKAWQWYGAGYGPPVIAANESHTQVVPRAEAWPELSPYVMPLPGSLRDARRAPRPIPFAALPYRRLPSPQTNSEMSGQTSNIRPRTTPKPGVAPTVVALPGSPVVRRELPRDNRYPPGKGTKEMKAKFRNGGLARLGRMVVDNVTEGLDLLDAMWGSIPSWRRGQYVDNFKQRHGKLPGVQDRLLFVYRNVQYMDPAKFARNLLENQIEDAIIGRLHKGANQSPFVQWTRDRNLSSPTAGPAL